MKESLSFTWFSRFDPRHDVSEEWFCFIYSLKREWERERTRVRSSSSWEQTQVHPLLHLLIVSSHLSCSILLDSFIRRLMSLDVYKGLMERLKCEGNEMDQDYLFILEMVSKSSILDSLVHQFIHFYHYFLKYMARRTRTRTRRCNFITF